MREIAPLLKVICRVGLALLIVSSLALVVSKPASACSCAFGFTPKQELQRSDAVFSGKVIDIRTGGGSVLGRFLGKDRIVKFEVAKSWKGISQRTITVNVGPRTSDCAYNFIKGKKYLIYAYKGNKSPQASLKTDVCTGTTLLANAKSDLQQLGPATIHLRSTTKDDPHGMNPTILAATALVMITLIFAILSWSQHRHDTITR